MERKALGGTGLMVSTIGFGASGLGEAFGEIDGVEGTRAVAHAVECGINLFDVSPYYGNTLAETRLGEALVGRRDRVVLSTKCGRYGVDTFDFSPGTITAGLEDSLRRLKTDHVDVLLAHDVEFGDLDRVIGETIPAMRAIQAAGKARFIGVSGYPLGALVRVMEAVELDVVLSYCRYNLLNTDMDVELSGKAAEAGVGLINASPLHMGILGGRPVPAWHPAPAEVQAAGALFAEVCGRYGVAPGAAALRFCTDYPEVATTLVGMASVEQVDENLAALTMEVPDGLWGAVEEVLGPVRGRVWASGRVENQ